MATVLFVIAFNGFRDEELFDTKDELEKAGHKVAIASTRLGTAKGVISRKAEATVLLEKAGAGYDAVAFIGGSGAAQLYNNPAALSLARGYYAANKPVAAICIAPGILAKARILNHKKATIWNGDGGHAAMIEESGGEYVDEPVVIDGNIITADGPAAARAFGRAIAKAVG